MDKINVQTNKNINEVITNEGGASMKDNKKKDSTESKNITEPPCTVIEVNKPNLENMAKSFTRLYHHVKSKQPELLDD
ncbi:hypothetical protein BKP35_10450 [Anaerobacillus arseniciselenatis]|uniref:Uncharacterized protein n=1 Tax=Anaerobacillus arseniciselenatis TaxID=85682 RepID=A0A1S2LKJ4_9BACI|nr:hypothetical protein [Anaerobacillus arseniciselenatis]OIJ12971.1 hypothetical protein BKP35_10450 [Anaerobacillus arseniciselenatis]